MTCASLDTERMTLEATEGGWEMRLKETGSVIGTVSIVKTDETINEIQLTGSMDEAYRGRSFMPEAVRAVIDHLMENSGCNRISAQCDNGDLRASRALMKCGMRYEGCLRQGGRNENGGYADIALYAILKCDKRRKDKLTQ